MLTAESEITVTPVMDTALIEAPILNNGHAPAPIYPTPRQCIFADERKDGEYETTVKLGGRTFYIVTANDAQIDEFLEAQQARLSEIDAGAERQPEIDSALEGDGLKAAQRVAGREKMGEMAAAAAALCETRVQFNLQCVVGWDGRTKELEPGLRTLGPVHNHDLALLITQASRLGESSDRFLGR